MGDDVQRIEVARVLFIARKGLGGEATLQRCEAEPVLPIAPYHESVQAVTKPADAVVEDDVGFGHYFPTQLGLRIEDDHVRLIEAGLPTVDLIDFEYGPGNRLWHTPQDTPENVSSGTLRMVGEVVAELVYRGG